MEKIITKTARDVYLRTKNRFYQTGWLDAERCEAAQYYPGDIKDEIYQQYLDGYDESMSNQFAAEAAL